MTKNKISEKKFFIMLSTELFALTSLMLPAILVGFAGKNGLPVLLGASGLLLLTAVWYSSCLGEGSQSPDQLLAKEKNGLIRGGISAVYILRYFIHGWFLMVVFVNLIREVLLPDYSFFWILVPLLLLTYITAGKGLSVRGRILEVLFPYIFIPLLVVLLFALFQVDFPSLPAQLWQLDSQTKKQSVLYGVYGILMFYQPVEFLLFLVPGLSEKEKNTSSIRWACLFAVAVNILMYVVTIGMFGTLRTGDKLWSALYIMQSVRLPGRFAERLDILFLVFWIFSVFALFSAYLYYGSRFVSSKGNKSVWKPYPFFWLFGILILTLAISGPRQVFEWFVPYKMWVDFPVSLLLPLFIYRKGRKKQKKSGQIPVIFTVLCILSLTGCQDRADIEDKNYVMTLGVEKGESREYKITYEIAGLSSGKQDEEKSGGRYVAYEADSLREAEEIDQTRDDKKLDFGHLKALVLSEEVMENGEAGRKLIDELEKKDTIAGTTLLFFTEEKVDELIESGGKPGQSFGEYVGKMTENQKKEKQVEDTLSKWLRNQAEGKGNRPVMMLRKEGEQIVLEIRKEFEDPAEPENRKVSEDYTGIVRFHIRAESDSEEDQIRKIKIKDRILPKLQDLLKTTNSKEDCLLKLTDSKERIHQWVREACREEDYQCDTNVYLCRESFPLKVYGDIIVPSGTYDALRIDLGKAEGANWWCMMYPSLCMMDDVTGPVEESRGNENKIDEAEKAGNKRISETDDWEGIYRIRKKNRYQIRFKFVEWISEMLGE